MSTLFWLDWAALSLSLFNMLLLVWLGITLLLTSDSRSLGVILAGTGSLFGGGFFAIHSLILGQSLTPLNAWMDLWWRVGWFLLVLSPLAWYVVILWYAGFWERGENPLRRRQRVGFLFCLGLSSGLMGLRVLGAPLPSFFQMIYLDLHSFLMVGGMPLVIAAFPVYILTCMLLSLDALLRPGPTSRPSGEQARRRARPWLVSATLLLLGVSVLVVAALLWIYFSAQSRAAYSSEAYVRLTWPVTLLDACIAGMIGLAVLLLGRAAVAYEIFKRKALPRLGLRRYYRNAVLLAAGSSVVVAGAHSLVLPRIYAPVLALLLAIAFYALLTWRSFAEREATIRQLRPFVASQRLYDQLLEPGLPTTAVDLQFPLEALCRDVLGTRLAALVPAGALAALVGAPRTFPPGVRLTLPDLETLRKQAGPEVMIVPLEPPTEDGLVAAVPLWSERGWIGVLFLGAKADGGFYTQEEIEIARASGERLLDLQASGEMARRLAALQRAQRAAQQTADQRLRRSLHDEVLPVLHTAMLQWGSAPPEALQALTGVHRKISDLLRDLPAAPAQRLNQLGLLGALRETLNLELADGFDGLHWEETPAAVEAAAKLPAQMAETLYFAAREAARNAARHARGERPLHLWVWAEALPGGGLQLVIEDDGVGLGAGNANHEGAGQGLSLHTTLMALMGGSLSVESQPDAFTRVTLRSA